MFETQSEKTRHIRRQNNINIKLAQTTGNGNRPTTAQDIGIIKHKL